MLLRVGENNTAHPCRYHQSSTERREKKMEGAGGRGRERGGYDQLVKGTGKGGKRVK